MKMFEQKVIAGGTRPKADPKWGVVIQKMLKECFVDHPRRPSMSDVCDTLRDEINALSDEEIADMMDISRKSQLSAS